MHIFTHRRRNQKLFFTFFRKNHLDTGICCSSTPSPRWCGCTLRPWPWWSGPSSGSSTSTATTTRGASHIYCREILWWYLVRTVATVCQSLRSIKFFFKSADNLLIIFNIPYKKDCTYSYRCYLHSTHEKYIYYWWCCLFAVPQRGARVRPLPAA